MDPSLLHLTLSVVLSGLAPTLPPAGTAPQPGTASSWGHPKVLCSPHSQGVARSQAQLRNDHKTEAFYGKMKPHQEREAERNCSGFRVYQTPKTGSFTAFTCEEASPQGCVGFL